MYKDAASKDAERDALTGLVLVLGNEATAQAVARLTKEAEVIAEEAQARLVALQTLSAKMRAAKATTVGELGGGDR
jgi:hypothetical protein